MHLMFKNFIVNLFGSAFLEAGNEKLKSSLIEENKTKQKTGLGPICRTAPSFLVA
jgi:hypothetical protein